MNNKELDSIARALGDLGSNFGQASLATVVRVSGSAYRRPGARMLIRKDGRTWGMVSGGCLEHDVLEHARSVMENQTAQLICYDSTSDDDILFGTGRGCKGVIDVLVEPVTEAFSVAFRNAVFQCQKERCTGGIATRMPGHGNAIGTEHAFLDRSGLWKGEHSFSKDLNEWGKKFDEPALIAEELIGGGAQAFIQPLIPPVHLVIFGGWLDVVPLVSMAKELGWTVTVIDSRRRNSSRTYFFEADSVLLCPPEEGTREILFDNRTFAVLMNHHFELDQEALKSLLPLSPRYIGLLGPKRRQMRLIEALASQGIPVSDEQLKRLHGPVGLDIGGESPEEIAVSIVGEIVALIGDRNGKPARQRELPLHSQPDSTRFALTQLTCVHA